MKHQNRLAIAIVGLSALLCTAVPSFAGVRVIKPKPKIEYRYFDPANKPKDMPSLAKDEAALCGSEYGVAAQLAYLPPVRRQNGFKYKATLDVSQVTVELSLTITVWLPNGASDKLKAHEDGHKKIAERIYAEVAEKAAREAGALLSGVTFTAEGATAREAEKAAIAAMNAAHSDMVKAYMADTSHAAQKIQVEYDRLTAHGLNPITEEDAIKQSWEKFTPRLWTPAATQPATRPVRGR